MVLMAEVKKITYESKELEEKVRKAVENPGQDKGDIIEACCFPIMDGCCIKMVAS